MCEMVTEAKFCGWRYWSVLQAHVCRLTLIDMIFTYRNIYLKNIKKKHHLYYTRLNVAIKWHMRYIQANILQASLDSHLVLLFDRIKIWSEYWTYTTMSFILVKYILVLSRGININFLSCSEFVNKLFFAVCKIL